MLIALATLFVLILSACATPPDTDVCVEIDEGVLGWCTYTISEKEFYVDNDKNRHPDGNKTWKEIKTESLIMPARSYGKVKAYIIKQCKKHNDCSRDISKWKRKTNKIQTKIQKANR